MVPRNHFVVVTRCFCFQGWILRLNYSQASRQQHPARHSPPPHPPFQSRPTDFGRIFPGKMWYGQGLKLIQDKRRLLLLLFSFACNLWINIDDFQGRQKQREVMVSVRNKSSECGKVCHPSTTKGPLILLCAASWIDEGSGSGAVSCGNRIYLQAQENISE